MRTLLTFLAFDGFPVSSWSKQEALPPLDEYSQYCLVHVSGQHEGQLKDMITEFLGQAFQWKKTLAEAEEFPWGLKWGSPRELKWDSPPWNYPDWPS
jgi:hypothetical protein